VVPTQPVLRPARVVLHEAAQRVAGLPGLADRLDLVFATATDLAPSLAVVPHLPTFDLDAYDARALDTNHEVDLVILEVIGDALAWHDDVACLELVHERPVGAALGGVEPRAFVRRDAHAPSPSPSCTSQHVTFDDANGRLRQL